MACYVRFGGLASIVVVDNDEEIDALIDRPDLDRTYVAAGPPINRVLVAILRHSLFRDGRALLSFRPRADSQRKTAQAALAQRLDAFAQRGPWAGEAIAAMATYAVRGTDRDAALAALTYATAYPFLAGADADQPIPFEPARFRHLFELYQDLKFARSRWKGLPRRLMGNDKRAAGEILKLTGGDDYGLHAVGITLDNSVLILENLRALFPRSESDKAGPRPFDWSKIRTAPATLTRQNRSPCNFAGIPGDVPANALILLNTRQALRPASPAGFEFASKHWSFCPASRYIEAIFARVYDTAEKLRVSP